MARVWVDLVIFYLIKTNAFRLETLSTRLDVNFHGSVEFGTESEEPYTSEHLIWTYAVVVSSVHRTLQLQEKSFPFGYSVSAG